MPDGTSPHNENFHKLATKDLSFVREKEARALTLLRDQLYDNLPFYTKQQRNDLFALRHKMQKRLAVLATSGTSYNSEPGVPLLAEGQKFLLNTRGSLAFSDAIGKALTSAECKNIIDGNKLVRAYVGETLEVMSRSLPQGKPEVPLVPELFVNRPAPGPIGAVIQKYKDLKGVLTGFVLSLITAAALAGGSAALTHHLKQQANHVSVAVKAAAQAATAPVVTNKVQASVQSLATSAQRAAVEAIYTKDRLNLYPTLKAEHKAVERNPENAGALARFIRHAAKVLLGRGMKAHSGVTADAVDGARLVKIGAEIGQTQLAGSAFDGLKDDARRMSKAKRPVWEQLSKLAGKTSPAQS